MSCYEYHFRWENAMRAYLNFINNDVIIKHIEINPYTLTYAYSYTLI